jgi:hypothetical protein
VLPRPANGAELVAYRQRHGLNGGNGDLLTMAKRDSNRATWGLVAAVAGAKTKGKPLSNGVLLAEASREAPER